jgi:hypothetical protein
MIGQVPLTRHIFTRQRSRPDWLVRDAIISLLTQAPPRNRARRSWAYYGTGSAYGLRCRVVHIAWVGIAWLSLAITRPKRSIAWPSQAHECRKEVVCAFPFSLDVKVETSFKRDRGAIASRTRRYANSLEDVEAAQTCLSNMFWLTTGNPTPSQASDV